LPDVHDRKSAKRLIRRKQMALDVWVGNPTRFKGGPAVSFEPEAYYWFLYPLFEDFAERHGKLIDLYDGAAFEGTELDHVIELWENAKSLIERQSEAFDIHMGTNMGTDEEPKKEEIYFAVRRSEYLIFIERLHDAGLKAKNSRKPLVFFGD
jgi:hypothetical protein